MVTEVILIFFPSTITCRTVTWLRGYMMQTIIEYVLSFQVLSLISKRY